jgi:hypothetical protein
MARLERLARVGWCRDPSMCVKRGGSATEPGCRRGVVGLSPAEERWSRKRARGTVLNGSAKTQDERGERCRSVRWGNRPLNRTADSAVRRERAARAPPPPRVAAPRTPRPAPFAPRAPNPIFFSSIETHHPTSRHLATMADNNDVASFFGFAGAASALVFSCESCAWREGGRAGRELDTCAWTKTHLARARDTAPGVRGGSRASQLETIGSSSCAVRHAASRAPTRGAREDAVFVARARALALLRVARVQANALAAGV